MEADADWDESLKSEGRTIAVVPTCANVRVADPPSF